MPKPVCENCNDTHQVEFESETRGWVRQMCTRCPVPCMACRHGAFCQTTPCPSTCHGTAPDLQAIAATRLLAALEIPNPTSDHLKTVIDALESYAAALRRA